MSSTYGLAPTMLPFPDRAQACSKMRRAWPDSHSERSLSWELGKICRQKVQTTRWGCSRVRADDLQQRLDFFLGHLYHRHGTTPPKDTVQIAKYIFPFVVKAVLLQSVAMFNAKTIFVPESRWRGTVQDICDVAPSPPRYSACLLEQNAECLRDEFRLAPRERARGSSECFGHQGGNPRFPPLRTSC